MRIIERWNGVTWVETNIFKLPSGVQHIRIREQFAGCKVGKRGVKACHCCCDNTCPEKEKI